MVQAVALAVDVVSWEGDCEMEVLRVLLPEGEVLRDSEGVPLWQGEGEVVEERLGVREGSEEAEADREVRTVSEGVRVGVVDCEMEAEGE